MIERLYKNYAIHVLDDNYISFYAKKETLIIYEMFYHDVDGFYVVEPKCPDCRNQISYVGAVVCEKCEKVIDTKIFQRRDVIGMITRPGHRERWKCEIESGKDSS